MIKNAGIMGSNLPANTKIPLVHPHDIAIAAAAELQKASEGFRRKKHPLYCE